MPLQSQTADLALAIPLAPVRARRSGVAVEGPKSGRAANKNGASFAAFAVRSLLVSGLMASGSIAALSSLGKMPHEPNAIIRASLAPVSPAPFVNADAMRAVAAAPSQPLSDQEIARQAEEAKKELAAASAITEAVTEPTRKTASAKSGYTWTAARAGRRGAKAGNGATPPP